jgi:hypothetical protein
MRLVLILLLPILCISCSKRSKNDIQIEGLSGKIKYIREWTFNSYGDPDETSENQVKENWKEKYYNKDGNLSEFILISGEDGEIESKTIYVYDSHKKKRESITYNRNEQHTFTTLYFYDDENNLVKEELYDSNKTFISYKTFLHNPNGFIIQENHFDQNNNLLKFSKYIYDNTGKKIETNEYTGDSLIYATKELDYFQNTIRQEAITTKPLSFTFREYDEHDSLILEYNHSLNGEINYKVIIEYDDQGNRTLENTLDGNGKTISYIQHEYIYDKKGDLIEQNSYKLDGTITKKILNKSRLI